MIMKKIVALVAALAVAGSLFAADAKTVVLTNTVGAQNDFAFLESAVTDAAAYDTALASKYAEGAEIEATSAIKDLYVAYKTNSMVAVSLSLKAADFSGGHNESVGYSLDVGGVEVASGAADATKVLEDAVDTKNSLMKTGLRANSARVTYKTAPDFSKVSAAKYKATLTLTCSAQ